LFGQRYLINLTAVYTLGCYTFSVTLNIKSNTGYLFQNRLYFSSLNWLIWYLRRRGLAGWGQNSSNRCRWGG